MDSFQCEEALLWYLKPSHCYLSYYPKLMTMGESLNVDQLVNPHSSPRQSNNTCITANVSVYAVPKAYWTYVNKDDQTLKNLSCQPQWKVGSVLKLQIFSADMTTTEPWHNFIDIGPIHQLMVNYFYILITVTLLKRADMFLPLQDLKILSMPNHHYVQLGEVFFRPDPDLSSLTLGIWQFPVCITQ